MLGVWPSLQVPPSFPRRMTCRAARRRPGNMRYDLQRRSEGLDTERPMETGGSGDGQPTSAEAVESNWHFNGV